MYRTILLVFFSIILVQTPVFAQAQLQSETSRARFEWFGEEMLYNIRALGMNIIHATATVSEPFTHPVYGELVYFVMRGSTFGIFDNIYHVSNRSITYSRLDDGHPVFSYYEFEERDYISNNTIAWDLANYRADVSRVDRDGVEERIEVAIPSNTWDEISMFLDLRSRDLTPDTQFVYYQYDGFELDRFIGTVTGIEEVTTEALGSVQAYVLEFTYEKMRSAYPLPYLAGQVALPPALEAEEDPVFIATGFYSLEYPHQLLGTDIHANLGDLSIRLLEWTPPTEMN